MSRVTDLLHNVTLRLPGFEPYWSKHRPGADTIRVFEIFLELTIYLHEHLDELCNEQLAEFREWIDWQMTSSDDEVEYAVHTTFLEAVADTPIEARSREFMHERARVFVDRFMHRTPKQRWFER